MGMLLMDVVLRRRVSKGGRAMPVATSLFVLEQRRPMGSCMRL